MGDGPCAAALALALLQVTAAPKQPAETPLEEFTRIGRALYAGDCPSVGDKLARTIEAALPNIGDPAKRLDAECDLGRAWVDLGRAGAAIELLEGVLARAERTSLFSRLLRLSVRRGDVRLQI